MTSEAEVYPPSSRTKTPNTGTRLKTVDRPDAVAHSLGERMKELCCLYAVSDICACTALDLDEAIQRLVDVIPPAWQYPDICSARATINGREYRSARFQTSEYAQRQPVTTDGRTVGVLEVFYAERRDPADEGPFLREERHLIDDLALRLGRVIESRSMQRVLDETEAMRQALLFATRDLVLHVDKEGLLLAFQTGDYQELECSLQELLHTNVRELRGRYIPRRLIEDALVRLRRVIDTGMPEVFAQRLGRNGSARECEVRIVRATSTTAFVVARDVTAQWMAHKAVVDAVAHSQLRFVRGLEACVCQRLLAVSDAARSVSEVAVDRGQDLVQQVNEVLAAIRQLGCCMAPARLETDGLAAALSDLVAHVKRAYGIECDLKITQPSRLPRDYAVAVQLFQVAREAIEDAVHGRGASRVVLSVSNGGSTTALHVGDNGSTPCARGDRAHGLAIVVHQVALVGGALTLRDDLPAPLPNRISCQIPG